MSDLNTNSLSAKTIEPLLTPRELGAMLKLSPSAVYRLVSRRQLPFHRVRRALRFRESDVRAFLDRSRVEAIQ